MQAIFYPLKTPKTLNHSGLVVPVQEAVAPSRPDYSGSLDPKSFIQLDLKICRYAYTGVSQMYLTIIFCVFGVFSGKFYSPSYF